MYKRYIVLEHGFDTICDRLMVTGYDEQDYQDDTKRTVFDRESPRLGRIELRVFETPLEPVFMDLYMSKECMKHKDNEPEILSLLRKCVSNMLHIRHMPMNSEFLFRDSDIKFTGNGEVEDLTKIRQGWLKQHLDEPQKNGGIIIF